MVINIGVGQIVDVPIEGVPELQFRICRREVGTDGGWTLVLGTPAPDAEGGEQELVRFDLFRDDPHYHVPASDPKATAIQVRGCDAALEFALERVREELPSMLEKASRADLASAATAIDAEALCVAIRSAARAAPEPTEFREVEIVPDRLGKP